MNETETRELAPPETTLDRGSLGPHVLRVQEWLSLQGHGVELDGDFGPATEAAVRDFQKTIPSPPYTRRVDGVVDLFTWRMLTSQLHNVIAAGELAQGVAELGERVVFIAQQHLRAMPREVGGQNRGPWVRLYMDGAEGWAWAWCAGFVTYVLGQAQGATSQTNRWRTFSCDELAMLGMGRQSGTDFLRGQSGMDTGRVSPGDFFLIRRGAKDWVHTGIVTKVDGEVFHAIEGNTNKEGAREGTEVRSRIRAFSAATDFILLGQSHG